jgi:hypothetical protein
VSISSCRNSEGRQNLNRILVTVGSTLKNGDIQALKCSIRSLTYVVQHIRDTLKPAIVETSMEFESIEEKLLTSSGFWIKEETHFTHWTSREIPILLILGSAGSGKSYLSGQIIRMLREAHPQGLQDASRTSVAYFFCKTHTPGLRSLRSLLITIAYQIAKNDGIYQKHMMGSLLPIQDSGSIRNLWEILFTNFFSRHDCRSSVLMIIDGIDEADEKDRTVFLKFMSEFHKKYKETAFRISILLVGRPEIVEEIQDETDSPAPEIKINPSKNSADIGHFIEESIKNSKLKTRSKALREEIQQKLTTGANGFFLWASLMLTEIEKNAKKRSDKAIRAILNQLPKDLSAALRQIVRGYAKLDKEDIDNINVSFGYARGECEADRFHLVYTLMGSSC